MDLLHGLETRHSVRQFLPTPIPDETLKRLLQAANRSPSYTNSQPWELAVVTGAKCDQLREHLYGIARAGTPSTAETPAPAQWPEDLARRAAEHHERRFREIGLARDDVEQRTAYRLNNYRFFGAPCVMFLFMERSLGPWSTFDLGLFAESLALAAHGLGLGSCLQASLTHYPDAVREFLGLPSHLKLMLGISVGYPDTSASINGYRSARRPLDEFVRWHS
jgi:nitroreductase